MSLEKQKDVWTDAFGIFWSVMLCFGDVGLTEKLLKNMRESCSSFLMHELLHPEYEITNDLE